MKRGDLVKVDWLKVGMSVYWPGEGKSVEIKEIKPAIGFRQKVIINGSLVAHRGDEVRVG